VEKGANAVGIDTACESLVYAKRKWMLEDYNNLLQMNASKLGFHDDKFDVVVCIQNGISAFKLEPLRLVQECIRITKPAGVCLFSSYCEEFWESTLEWFQLQSEEGLLGEIN
jgi:2-polyprenyl-6-hydroxyphenyl methylase/3-demethylubiquinone-9 3-methyltransferase